MRDKVTQEVEGKSRRRCSTKRYSSARKSSEAHPGRPESASGKFESASTASPVRLLNVNPRSAT
jgi:hypothetical protein